MKKQDFTTSFTVDQSPEEVFRSINNVRGWWSGEVDGNTDSLGAEFTYRYQNMHRSTQKVTEFVLNKKIVWRVTDAELTFVKDKKEWIGTDIVFEIAGDGAKTGVPNDGPSSLGWKTGVPNDGPSSLGWKTELRFTHMGLVPAIECYGGCSGAWGMLVGTNLRNLIATGKNQPDVFA